MLQEPAVDLTLLDRMRGGDESAFGELLTRYWRPLLAYAQRLGAGADEADDAVQSIFIRLWEKRDSWRPDGSVRALLYRMTRDAVFDQAKSAARRVKRHLAFVPDAAPAAPSPADELDRTDVEAALAAAVADLSDRRRAVYQLTRVEGLSYREAAVVLGIAPQTAANHLSAALAELYRSLQRFLEPSSSPPGLTHRSQP